MCVCVGGGVKRRVYVFGDSVGELVDKSFAIQTKSTHGTSVTVPVGVGNLTVADAGRFFCIEIKHRIK